MKLFYLDDDEDLLAAYQNGLHSLGNWSVDTEWDPIAAVNKLGSKRYNVYLLDWKLSRQSKPHPGLNSGDKVHAELKARNCIAAESPVIYISGHLFGKNFMPGELWLPDFDHYLLCRPDDIRQLDKALTGIYEHHQKELGRVSPVRRKDIKKWEVREVQITDARSELLSFALNFRASARDAERYAERSFEAARHVEASSEELAEIKVNTRHATTMLRHVAEVMEALAKRIKG